MRCRNVVLADTARCSFLAKTVKLSSRKRHAFHCNLISRALLSATRIATLQIPRFHSVRFYYYFACRLFAFFVFCLLIYLF